MPVCLEQLFLLNICGQVMDGGYCDPDLKSFHVPHSLSVVVAILTLCTGEVPGIHSLLEFVLGDARCLGALHHLFL